MKIEDFGEKIGDARKDLWSNNGLQITDISSMNDRELLKHVTKNKIWAKPDFEALANNGYSTLQLYFIKKVRDSLPAKPILNQSENIQEQCSNYIKTIRQIESDCMSIENDIDITSFFEDNIIGKFVERSSSFSRYVTVKPEAQTVINNKVLKAMQVHWLSSLENEIEKKQFLFSEEEKLLSDYHFYEFNSLYSLETRGDTNYLVLRNSSQIRYIKTQGDLANKNNWIEGKYFIYKKGRVIANNFDTYEHAKEYALAIEKVVQPSKTTTQNKKRKTQLVPPQLKHIVRDGENYRQGRNVRGEDYLKEFQFRGGEFGNYMNELDRQQSLNFGYDALLDLSRALHIEPKDISLDGKLSIAFGARGHGNALAHYEPLRTVINLTKMNGAGSLAHEWGHALDDYIATKIGVSNNTFMATSSYYSKEVREKLPSLYKLVETMKYGKDFQKKPRKTNYYRNALEIDGKHSKQAHGYWASEVEMFARAFACYVHDKLDYKSDYLCGHAYAGQISEDITTYPRGEEMKDISACFDDLFKELKTLEYLHDYTPPLKETLQENKQKETYDFVPYENTNGQFSLFDMENEMEMSY